jgi:hypothetical protein
VDPHLAEVVSEPNLHIRTDGLFERSARIRDPDSDRVVGRGCSGAGVTQQLPDSPIAYRAL